MKIKFIFIAAGFLSMQALAGDGNSLDVSFKTKMAVAGEQCVVLKATYGGVKDTPATSLENSINKGLIEASCTVTEAVNEYYKEKKPKSEGEKITDVAADSTEISFSSVCGASRVSLELAKERFIQAKSLLTSEGIKRIDTNFTWAVANYKQICEISWVPDKGTFDFMIKTKLQIYAY